MAEQSTRLNRRWLYIPFIIAGVIVFAYYLLWRAGAGQMKIAVGDWIDEQRQAGLVVNHGAIKSDGFPFFLRVHIDNPQIISTEEWSWRGERLSLDALPYDLNKLIFSTTGEQSVSAQSYGEWRINAEDLRASIARDSAREWVFSMNIGGAHAKRDQDGATLSLESLVFDLAPDSRDNTTLTLTLAAAQLDANIDGDAYTLNTLQTATSLSQAHVLADGAAQWRSAGGILRITGLFADLEETKLSASGEVSLDANHRPIGAITTKIENPASFARMLGKTGVITHNEAEIAAAGLSLMAFAAGGLIEAPIELKDGEAQIGGVKIADLPRVE